MPAQNKSTAAERMEAHEYEKALKFFRELTRRKVNMYGAPSNLAKFGKHTAAESKKQASELGLKGWLYWLYVMEYKAGKISSDLAAPDESLIETLSAGVLHEGKTKLSGKPGAIKTEQTPSGSEQLEKVPSASLDFIGKLLSSEGLRLLEIIGGAALVLFGMYVLVKGEPPTVSTVTKHVV